MLDITAAPIDVLTSHRGEDERRSSRWGTAAPGNSCTSISPRTCGSLVSGSSQARQLLRHRHTGPVHVFTMAGAWKYLEYEDVNRAGSYLYEPANSTHTFSVIEETGVTRRTSPGPGSGTGSSSRRTSSRPW